MDEQTHDYCEQAIRQVRETLEYNDPLYRYRYYSPARPLGRWIGLDGEYDISGRYLWTVDALNPADICRLELLPANGRALRLLREQTTK